MLQVAVPSRENVGEYQRIRDDIELLVGRVNGDLGRVGDPAIHYLHQPVSREELVAMYVAADVLLVTPLRDGMNLVAKEYIASRTEGTGAVVLSEFTGCGDPAAGLLPRQSVRHRGRQAHAGGGRPCRARGTPTPHG